MSVTISTTNKPLNPRAQDLSPKGYNRASLYSGKALDFDGVNDSVGLGAISGTLSNLSMSWYIKTTNTADFQCLFANGAGKFDVYIRPDKKIHVWTGSQQSFYEIPDIQTGDWINLVLVKDGANASLYYNGQLAQTIAFSGSSFSITNGFVGIGLNSLYDFNGQIAGFKIFNTALTAAQVSDLYLNPEKIVPDGVANSALKLWLPMMEGAGTTAYDGSGNGNDGTISGATWTAGIGAPVAQTALVSWNKGRNLALYSEQFDNGYWSKDDVVITANDTTAPDGQTTAERVTDNTNNARHRVLVLTSLTNNSSKSTASIFVKEGTHRYAFLETSAGSSIYTIVADLQTGTITDETGSVTKDDSSITSYGNGWYRISVSITAASNNTVYIQFGPAGSATPSYNNYVPTYIGSSEYIYAWGAQVSEAESLGSYVRTELSKQESPVLLPQGLTTGRDITGVNLFENVRNQFALNLDGNSWAEVHDNASLDFGTGEFTLEAWAKAAYVNQGSGLNTIFSLGGSSSGGNTMSLNIDSGLLPIIYYNGFYSVDSSAQTAGDWFHIVGTYDETNRMIYVNGVQVDQDAQTAASITNALVKQIGRDTNANRLYQDQIALPRIYNRALTATEVSRNYNADKSKFGL